MMSFLQISLKIFNSRYGKYFLRLSFVSLTILCLITLHNLDWDDDQYFHSKDYYRLLIGIISNIGLWIITTSWSKMNRVKAIMTLVPTIFISTFIVSMHSFIFPVFFFLLMLFFSFLTYRSGDERTI